ncbi:unnamed protein product [Effrenium voratum]|nr:unnamed protein product [Effrenium voratum]
MAAPLHLETNWRGAQCVQALFGRFRRQEHYERRPSEVDERLMGSDTDRLLAGVARLFYRHIAEGDALESSGSKAVSPQNGKPSQGAPLTASDFNEELFSEQPNCKRRFSMRRFWRYFRQPALADQIYALLKNIAELSEFKKEMAVLAAIYTERLLKRHPNLHLTKDNWRPLLIASLHLASKTWEDVHAWNSDFSHYLRVVIGLQYSARSLFCLEQKMLVGLDYHMEVCGELYASYYFALTEEAQRHSLLQSLHQESLMAGSPKWREMWARDEWISLGEGDRLQRQIVRMFPGSAGWQLRLRK